MEKILVLLLCLNIAWGKSLNGYKHSQCDDCISILECKEAAPYINITKENLEYIAPFYCGLSKTFNVCCSRLKALSVTTPIKEHPNLKLLPDTCGEIYSDIDIRTTSRSLARMYEFPWMVLISYEEDGDLWFKCSGTLINSRYVLTAAHCVQQGLKIAGVRVGEYEIDEDRDCEDDVCENNLQDMEVEEVIVHEDYSLATNNPNDIALIRLKEHVNMKFRNADTICLPISENLQNRDITGRYATVAGWGITEDHSDSTILLKVTLNVKSNRECQEFHRSLSPSEMEKICAGTVGIDSCDGDSGGPVMLQDYYKDHIKYVQFGIVSSGPIECGSGLPGLYTDVRKYVNWILDNIKE